MAHLTSPRLPRGALRIVGVIVIAGLIIAACGAPQAAEIPTEIAAATATPTPLPTGTPAPTDTPTSRPQAVPTPSPAPTNPPPADTPASAPSATDTPVPNTATPVPTQRPTRTPGVTYPPPALLAPQEKDAQSLSGPITFRWTYPRALRSTEAFQVLIWKEGNPHWGAAELWTDTQQTIDLDGVLPQRGGPGDYLWTVVVREKGTEKLLSPEAPAWRLTYVGDPCASCDCQANCRSGNCNPCCEACCDGCQ